MEPFTGRVLRGLFLLVITFSVTACATVSKKFSPSLKENVGVFADQTVAILSQADLGFERQQAIYIRPFWRPEEKEEQSFIRNRNRAKDAFRAIIVYSFRLVFIAEQNDSDQQKIKAYADFLGSFDDRVLEDLQFKPDHYAGLIQEIRSKETFLDAIRAAQPIINAAGQAINRILDDTEESANALEAKLSSRIDEEYADVRRYQKILETEKYAVFGGLEELYLMNYKGDAGAYDRLVKSKVIWPSSLMPTGPPSDNDVMRLRDSLLTRLDNLNRIWSEVAPDWENYRATHLELDKLHSQMLQNIKRARMITLLWVRAHQKMGLGTLNPAEWIDVKELISTGVKFF